METQTTQTVCRSLNNNLTAGAKSTVNCAACNHENRTWQVQCEKCGEALNCRGGTAAPLAATSDQRTLYERLTWRSERAKRAHQWILALGALLFIVRILSRCTADSQPDIPPLFSNDGAYEVSDYQPGDNDQSSNPGFISISSTGAGSPFTTDSEWSDTETYATQTFTIVHPAAWRVGKSDETAVLLSGEKEIIALTWREAPDMPEIMRSQQTAPSNFRLIAAKFEQIVRTNFEGLGEISNLSRIEPAQLRDLPLLFGAYEARLRMDSMPFAVARFDTRCAEQRSCIILYMHEGDQPVSASAWEKLAQIAGSWQFVGDGAE